MKLAQRHDYALDLALTVRRGKVTLMARDQRNLPRIMVRAKGELMIIRKAVLPVAGLGTRFLPATKAQPKEMLPIVTLKRPDAATISIASQFRLCPRA